MFKIFSGVCLAGAWIKPRLGTGSGQIRYFLPNLDPGGTRILIQRKCINCSNAQQYLTWFSSKHDEMCPKYWNIGLKQCWTSGIFLSPDPNLYLPFPTKAVDSKRRLKNVICRNWLYSYQFFECKKFKFVGRSLVFRSDPDLFFTSERSAPDPSTFFYKSIIYT